MKKERTEIAVAHLRTNTGQLDTWLPSNPRQWTQTDIDRTAASIREDADFLEDRPLLVVSMPDTPDFIVFAGNLRLEGCKAAKRAKVPCVVYVPESDEDRATIKRRAMKDNGSFGSWDFDALANEWDDLPLTEWGIQVSEEWASGASASDSGSGSAGTATEDDFDEDQDDVETRCVAGDIWQLGDHRLMCGDSTSPADFALLMDGNQARLCVTSPPYGVGKSYEEAGIEPWRKTIFGVIEVITKCARIIDWNIGDLFATGTQFIEPTSMYSVEKMADCGFGLMYSRIWKKQGGNFAGTEPYYTVSMKPVQEYEWILGFAKRDYENDYAPIIEWMSQQAKKANLNNAILKEITGAGFMFGHWFTPHQFSMLDRTNYEKIADYCRKSGIDAFQMPYDEIRRKFDDLNIYGKILTAEDEAEWGRWAIWEINTVNKRTGGHPAEFPVELPARCIKMHSRPGDIIVDPFGGSGTTMIAAEQLGRKAYLMELDQHYCDVIIARWEKLTGKTATKIN